MLTRFLAEGRLVAGLTCLALCSCTAIEHGPELQEARERMETATGRRPGWQVDMPVRELSIPAAGELTEDVAIDLALTNNRALRADLEGIGQAKAELVQAGLLSNPMASVMLRFPEAGGRADLSFGFAQDLADLWLIPARKRAAQSMLHQRLLSFTDGAVALVRDVKTKYAMLQYLDSAIDLQNENLEILRQAIPVAQARLRAGATQQLDVNLLEARRLQGELELLQLQNERRTAQVELLRLMGVARAAIDWRTSPPPDGRSEPDLDEQVLLDWGLSQRLDVLAAGWEVDAALAEFAQQKLRLVQSFGVGLSGELFEQRAMPGRNLLADTARASIANGQLTAPEIEPRSVRQAARAQEIDFVLGPALEFPLPIFDQNQAQIAKARYRARELHERYSELEQAVADGIRRALLTFRLAAARRKIYQDSLLPIRESNLQVAETTYQSGTDTILTVLLAQQELIEARLGLAGTLRDAAVSTANLERELGGHLPRASELQPATQPARDELPESPALYDVGSEP